MWTYIKINHSPTNMMNDANAPNTRVSYKQKLASIMSYPIQVKKRKDVFIIEISMGVCVLYV